MTHYDSYYLFMTHNIGYNVPDSKSVPFTQESEQFKFKYFSGSKLLIEWSQANGCRSKGQNCSVIIQGIIKSNLI